MHTIWLLPLSVALAVACGNGSSGGGNGGAGSSSGSNGSSGSGGSSGAGSSGATSSGGAGSSSGTGSSGAASSSGTGSSGAGSSSGTASSSGTGSSSGSGGDGGGNTLSQSVLQRGNDLYRRATYVEPGLTTAAAATMAPDTTFDTNATFPANGNLSNQGTASVLYLEEGPTAAGCPAAATGCTAKARTAGAGLFFAFPALGSNPNVVAFDETSGLPVWTAHLTTGGDGVRGTPVVDPAARRLYVVTGGNPHLVHAVSVDDGTEVATGGWPVTLSSTTLTYANTGFNSGSQNQHGALLLLNGILYIPFGGQYGDGGTYLGWIVAVDTTDPTKVAGWATQSARSGIWGSGGLASDGTYVFGVTGDTTNLPRATSDSEEVLRVKGMAAFSRDEASVYVPTEWQGWDRPAGDLDFGASTPSYVPLPAGSNPPALLVAPAKAGRVYVLTGNDLSAGSYPTPGGELADLVVANTTGESVYTAPTVYSSASGLHATINVGQNPANCPAGTPTSSEMIVSLLLQPGQAPIAKEVWCAPNAGGGHTNYPPISTTTDGASADALVWFMNGTQLSAVDGDTGKSVAATTGTPCASVPSMSFPIAVKNRIVVAALGHLCSWSPGGT
ncbi:MAG TPA: hypothetical protein VGG39_38020 [Polyangiaceae bacterium]